MLLFYIPLVPRIHYRLLHIAMSNNQESKVKRKAMYLGDQILDGWTVNYTWTSWGDPLSLTRLFDEKIVPRCDSAGYHRVIRDWPAISEEVQKKHPIVDFQDEPFIDLLNRFFEIEASKKIFEMSFGPIFSSLKWVKEH